MKKWKDLTDDEQMQRNLENGFLKSLEKMKKNIKPIRNRNIKSRKALNYFYTLAHYSAAPRKIIPHRKASCQQQICTNLFVQFVSQNF